MDGSDTGLTQAPARQTGIQSDVDEMFTGHLADQLSTYSLTYAPETRQTKIEFKQT